MLYFNSAQEQTIITIREVSFSKEVGVNNSGAEAHVEENAVKLSRKGGPRHNSTGTHWQTIVNGMKRRYIRTEHELAEEARYYIRRKQKQRTCTPRRVFRQDDLPEWMQNRCIAAEEFIYDVS